MKTFQKTLEQREKSELRACLPKGAADDTRSPDLYKITATVPYFMQKWDDANAVTLYEVVAITTLSHYLSRYDEGGM